MADSPYTNWSPENQSISFDNHELVLGPKLNVVRVQFSNSFRKDGGLVFREEEQFLFCSLEPNSLCRIFPCFLHKSRFLIDLTVGLPKGWNAFGSSLPHKSLDDPSDDFVEM